MLLCLSLNAKRAPLELRESFALLPEELADVRSYLGPHVAEAFVLSTCHRFEAYVAPRVTMAGPCLAGLLAGYRRIDPDRLIASADAYTGYAAAEHLFRVTAGLESQVLGEAQILGQVRRALEAARAIGLAGHRLARLVQRALCAGRHVREETALGRGALSVSRVAVDQAARELGSLAGRTVVLVGAGETGRLAAKALAQVGHLIVVNRTLERAQALAGEREAEARPWAALPDALAEADLVLCCTGTTRPTITHSLVAAAQRRRAGRPLLLVDLALPRGIEPEVAQAPGVRLITLDHVRERCSARLEERQREVPKVEGMLTAELERAWRSWEGDGAHDAIVALRQRAEDVRHDELSQSLRRLDGLSPEQLDSVDYVTRAIVNKLLHRPTVWLKAHSDRADQMVRELFGVEAVR